MNDPRITLPLARLAADPERKQTRNGTPYLLIRVAATDMGWHRYEQPDGDPTHICPECAEKEAMK